MKSLKNYNFHLFSFVILNLLLLGIGSYPVLDFNNLNIESFIMIVPLPSLIILSTIILNGVLSSDMKYKLVFLRINYPLPASRLERTIKSDHRFSIDQVIQKFGDIPSNPKEQNLLWYQKMYKPNQDSEKVRDVHKKFLMTRDMTAISFMILIFSIVNAIFLQGTLLHLVIVAIEYLVIGFVAANYGKRFVSTAVAEAI